MKVMFYTPYFHQPRGNSTTAKRMVRFLQERGIQVSVTSYLEEEEFCDVNFDFNHVLHATRFLQWASERGVQLTRPYIVTMGGTDINEDLKKPSKEELTFLERASFITVFTEDAMKKVMKMNPEWEKKTKVIPQSVGTISMAKENVKNIAPRILLPAGLRPVKDVLHVLPALDLLVKDYPNLNFTIIGANLDTKVFLKVMEEAGKRPWMEYAGVVSLEEMPRWYEQADIVINTSISEGQSLALLEAMSFGRLVVARKNQANESLISHNRNGLIYETPLDFVEAVKRIMESPSQRNKIVQKAREKIIKDFSIVLEAERYIQLYRSIPVALERDCESQKSVP